MIFLGFILSLFFVILYSWHDVDIELWQHFLEYSLPILWVDTSLLVLGVSITSLFLGVSLAWITTIYDFFGRKILSVILIFPMALPPFILAFSITGSFDYNGLLDQFFYFFWKDSPGSISGLAAAIPIFSLALYPYIYLLVRVALSKQGTMILDTAYTLGYSPTKTFFYLYIPMIKNSALIGLSLVIMEVLADFGAVYIFNIETPTILIYKSWTGFFSLTTALQISSLLILLVAILVILGRQLHSHTVRSSSHSTSWRLKFQGIKSYLATLYCSCIFIAAFLLPVVQLLVWAFDAGWSDVILIKSLNSVILAAITACILVIFTLLVGYYGIRNKTLKEIMGMGYALPGTVIAIAIIFIFTSIDQVFSGVGSWLIGSTVIGLVIGYSVRFFRLALSPIEQGISSIHPHMRESAMLLGMRKIDIIRKIYISHLSPFILTGALIVFVEVIKEIPVTLILRPFGWDNLATMIFEFTTEARWSQASIPALIIVAISTCGTWIFYMYSQRHSSK